jgi:hypothetical protein
MLDLFVFGSFLALTSLFDLSNIHFAAPNFVMHRHSLANFWFSTILGLAIEPHPSSAFSIIDFGFRS